ncbi:hypothetical protein J2X19_003013 [Rhodoferax ferrireducens]|uniref:Uncharacterized protein n=1 Tax=Rhodoferax ferrireducens TaxID=192843 RepID=A0ABU2CAK9_9BURK|nr:hypothetical protein [Rhodoferax ferrireducens]
MKSIMARLSGVATRKKNSPPIVAMGGLTRELMQITV